MNEMGSIKDQLLEMWNGMVDGAMTWLPRIVIGIVAIILILIVAKVLEKVVGVVLRKVKLDALVEKIGLDTTLKKTGMNKSPSLMIGRLVYFLFLFMVIQTAADVLGLEPISNAIGGFMAYLPALFSALLLLVVGTVVGPFAGKAITTAGREAGLDFAPALGRVVSGLIMFIVTIMAVGQLRFDTEIIRIFAACALGGAALAFGISFGLGTREAVRNIIAGFYAKKLFNVGTTVEVDGESGVLTSITPTKIVLERDGRSVSIANSRAVETTVRH